jgi:hypothetical protein
LLLRLKPSALVMFLHGIVGSDAVRKKLGTEASIYSQDT